MKKAIGYIVSSVMAAVGLILFIAGYATQKDSYGYTWTPPYTSFEFSVLMTKYIGITILIIGIVVLILLIAKASYTSKNVKDIHGGSAEFLTCPICHCKTTLGSSECPNCHYKFKS